MKNRITLVMAILPVLACVALLATARAVSPPPDGGYPGGNTAEGQNALLHRTTGGFNAALGWYSLFSETTHSYNTGVGAGTLALNGAADNTAVGTGAMLLNISGHDNTAYGTDALLHNNSGNFNNAVGAFALFNNIDGSFNNAFGEDALNANIHGAANTAIGDLALANNDVTGAGLGSVNTAVGAGALFNNTDGNSNNAVGFNALGANEDGLFNNAIGFGAMADNLSGAGNVAIGDSAGAGVEGDFNIYIGFAAGPAPSPSPVPESETIRIGDVFNTACYIGGIDGATVDPGTGTAVFVDADGKLGTVVSSKRFKEDIKAMDKASEAIEALQPVTYHYKKQLDPRGIQQFGLIAEDVAKVNPNLVVRDRNGDIKTVRYEAVNAMLLNEFLKEHKKVEALERGMEVLTTQLKEQAAQIQKVSAQLEVRKPATKVVVNKP
jgi:hypothetical protein